MESITTPHIALLGIIALQSLIILGLSGLVWHQRNKLNKLTLNIFK